MEQKIVVFKFGGTSVGSGERIRRVAGIIAHTVNNLVEASPVIVVSAMAGITDQLIRIANHVCIGEYEQSKHELQILKQRHRDAVAKAVHNCESHGTLLNELEAAFTMLEQDVAAFQSATWQTLGQVQVLSLYIASIAAWGERLSVLLLAATARDLGVQAVAVREELIITSDRRHDATQSPGIVAAADPLPDETRIRAQTVLYPLLRRGIVPVVAGFIGRTATGHVITMGRNGSDYSATVIGAALDCIEVSIYTDVDGVMSADPRLVKNVRLLPRLSYAEAARLSWFGAKVLHPRTLMPLAHRNIPVQVRNTFRPHTYGTVVGPEGTQRSGARAITTHRHLALITVESTDLFGAPENAGQVFVLAARAGAAPIAICSSSGHHLAFMVEEQAAEAVVAFLQHDLDLNAWRVSCRRGLAACACIGSGFTADPMSPAHAISALARERIAVITQGASELGITLIVEDRDSEHALRCLHRNLIVPVIPLERRRHIARAQVVL